MILDFVKAERILRGPKAALIREQRLKARKQATQPQQWSGPKDAA